MTPSPVVYKICRLEEWTQAVRRGFYGGSRDDERDGFIHLSAPHQVEGTAAKYFVGQTDLVLLGVDAKALGPSLRWEPSRGGQDFPHVYGPLPVDAVVDTMPLSWNAERRCFPALENGRLATTSPTAPSFGEVSPPRVHLPLPVANALRWAAQMGQGMGEALLGRTSVVDVAAEAIVRAPHGGHPAVPRLGNQWFQFSEGHRITFAVKEPPPNVRPKGTVFVLHGLRDSKETMADVGSLFAQQGFRAVLPDLRGHGGSSGATLSFGHHEASDLQALLDHLVGQGLCPPRVGVLGFSYGAAVALTWAARDPRLRAVATIAGFAALRDVLPDYVRVPLPPHFWDQALARAAELAQFDPTATAPKVSVQRLPCPLWVIHGMADGRVPVGHAQTLAEARPQGTDLWLVPGAGHRSVFNEVARSFSTRIAPWFRQHLEASGQPVEVTRR